MKQKEQKNGMNPSQEQFPAVEMRVAFLLKSVFSRKLI